MYRTGFLSPGDQVEGRVRGEDVRDEVTSEVTALALELTEYKKTINHFLDTRARASRASRALKMLNVCLFGKN